MLFDQYNIYKYNIDPNAETPCDIFLEQNCTGVFTADGNYCYTLSHSGNDRSSGLRLYDINTMINKNTDTCFLLDQVQVGVNGHIDWNAEHARFSFLRSLNCLEIVPALHRNTIAFLGMNKRETYIATQMQKDKFIALDNQNHLFCWSVLTGKLLSTNKLSFIQDYSNF